MSKREVSTDAIAHAIDALDAIENAIHIDFLDWIVKYDTREAWKEDGACSMADWIAYRRGYALATAREFVRIAHALRELPCIRLSFAEGRISREKLALVTQVADAASDALWASEAEQLSVARLQVWVRRHHRVGREEAERRLRARYLRMRWNDEDATLRINARLVGDDAAYVKRAIEHLADEQPRAEDGTYAPYEHRCADALAELAASRLGERDRATVVVHIDAAELHDSTGMGALEAGPAIVSETVRRLACDGKVRLSLDDAAGSPFKLGRTVRTASPWQRRHVIERDRGCRFADCGRTRGVQMHHMTHWAHGGPTEPDNLLTLCPYHHRLVHEGGWTIRKDEHDPALHQTGRSTPQRTSDAARPARQRALVRRRASRVIGALGPQLLRPQRSAPNAPPPTLGPQRWAAPLVSSALVVRRAS